MEAAPAPASRRARPNRGRPLVPPNYVSLRDLRDLRLREKEEQRRREEEEAEARRVREEQRKRQVEEEEAAARRFVEERRRREEEAAAARRARDAAAAARPRPEMRALSSSSTSSFRNNERARGGQRLVVVADRPPPPRGECAAVKIDGATGGCRVQKGPDSGAANAPPGGGFKAQNAGRGNVSAGMVAGLGEPAKPALAPSHAGKPEEKTKGEASGCQGISLLGDTPARISSASGELAKVEVASNRGPVRQRHNHQGRKKGLDGRSTVTAMTSSIREVVDVLPLPLPVVNLENKGKSRSGDRSNETALASMPAKAAEASPSRGVKSDNNGKKKPSGGRQASEAPGGDLRDSKKVDALGFEDTTSGVSIAPGEQADACGASYRMPLKPVYKRKGKNGLDGRSTESSTTIVASKAADASPLGDVSLGIKGKSGLIKQGTETALARMPGEVYDASIGQGFMSEDKGKNESSGGRHTDMAPSTYSLGGMKAQTCRGSERSSGGQGMTQAAKSEAEEEERVAAMRTAAQLKPCDMRNSGRQRPGGHSRVNVTARQRSMVWVPKAASLPDNVEVGKFP